MIRTRNYSCTLVPYRLLVQKSLRISSCILLRSRSYEFFLSSSAQ